MPRRPTSADVASEAGVSRTTVSFVLNGRTDIKIPPGEKMTIAVNGQQYVWRYGYPGKDRLLVYTDMVVPVGMTVLLDITADDVVHSWWIPKLGGKFDAVPGYTNHTWFKIPGKLAGRTFTGQCAELCGRNHANMVARVTALKPDQYEGWLDRQRNAIRRADQAAQQQRKNVDAGKAPGPG